MTRKNVSLLILLLSCLLRVPASGEAEEIAPTLTLEGAISLALERNPRVAERQAENAIAQAHLARARANFLPSLQVQEVYTRTTDPVAVFGAKLSQNRFSARDFNPATLTNPELISNFHSIVSFSQSLYTGGRDRTAFAHARLLHQASAFRYDREIQEVIFATTASYYQVLLTQQQLMTLHAAIQTAQLTANIAQQRFDSGFIVKADVLSAEVRLAALKKEEIVASHQLTLIRARLNDTMGTALDSLWNIDDHVGRREYPLPTVSELEQQALNCRPDYQQLLLEEQAQQQLVRQAQAAFLPTIRGVASYDLYRSNFTVRGGDSWTVGVIAQWNLFNGGADAAGVAETRAILQRVQALLMQAANRIKLEIRDALMVLQSARARITVAEQAVTQAEAAMQIAADRYQSGLVTLVDTLAKEEALTQARSSLAEALYDYRIGWAQVDLASGVLCRTAPSAR